MRRRFRGSWKNCQFQWRIMAYTVLCVSVGLHSDKWTFCSFNFYNCRCAQCFRAFQDGVFYEFEGRKYCERDFHVLFAPCCNKCGEFVIGRVIKAMAANWHPHCFCCESCGKELADCGFIRNQVITKYYNNNHMHKNPKLWLLILIFVLFRFQNRALCHDCNARDKAGTLGKYICNKCQ